MTLSTYPISNGLPAFNLGPSFLEYAIQREMKMATHSPMWRKSEDGRLVCYPEGLTAGLLSNNLPEGEKEANELLILTAPDLLEALDLLVAEAGALERLVHRSEHKAFYHRLDDARAAIAKATGGA
jgi:hypothetical protein